jgi:hypothetical protein
MDIINSIPVRTEDGAGPEIRIQLVHVQCRASSMLKFRIDKPNNIRDIRGEEASISE